MRPNAEHVLDYFQITMRITVLQQMARGLPAQFNAAAPAAVAVLESVRCHLWHAYVGSGPGAFGGFWRWLDLISDPPHEGKRCIKAPCNRPMNMELSRHDIGTCRRRCSRRDQRRRGG
ncbi:hypothetical protein C7I87_31535 [Mesorhizobium sp. SARCC-RB16n]|nr:hypothetical protein C7I87_31535 [Mesorhizobium sp. SARCC-RB16n]